MNEGVDDKLDLFIHWFTHLFIFQEKDEWKDRKRSHLLIHCPDAYYG